MKRKFFSFAALGLAAVCAVSMAACGKTDEGRSHQLGKPVEFKAGESDNLSAFRSKADAFASSFAAETYAAGDKTENFTVSPVSVYSALALAAECAAGETRAEILSAMGVTYEQLKANYPALYGSLNVTNEYDGEVVSTLALGNSVWLDERLEYKQSCVDALSEFYQTYTYSADFHNDNAAANLAVRAFVRKQTRGLIDKDFQLSEDTLFALINTLYLKTVWNTNGTDLPFTDRNYDFKNADDSTTSVNLLQGDYALGRVYESETFTSFYASASGGYKIKFILPKDGETLSDVFTAENIAEANSIVSYGGYDGEIEYKTRCLFPEYKCRYDNDVKELLKEKFGINLLFDRFNCDYSTMTDTPAVCTKVQHVTDLTVDKTGIEGAAVTVMANEATSVPPHEIIYEDFVLDRAFGFLITDRNDVALFSGAVNRL